jgi:hypothetical protein
VDRKIWAQGWKGTFGPNCMGQKNGLRTIKVDTDFVSWKGMNWYQGQMKHGQMHIEGFSADCPEVLNSSLVAEVSIAWLNMLGF